MNILDLIGRSAPLFDTDIQRHEAELSGLVQSSRFLVIGGAGSIASYGLALWAMTKAPIAMVAALRETSVIFGMLLAVVLLHEKFTFWRGIAVVLVAFGAMILKLT